VSDDTEDLLGSFRDADLNAYSLVEEALDNA
jgi:hypothetical protein